jgi:hypothetical protein
MLIRLVYLILMAHIPFRSPFSPKGPTARATLTARKSEASWMFSFLAASLICSWMASELESAARPAMAWAASSNWELERWAGSTFSPTAKSRAATNAVAAHPVLALGAAKRARRHVMSLVHVFFFIRRSLNKILLSITSYPLSTAT